MDIELAIERMLVVNHIKFRPEILTAYSTTSKMGPIPGFHTTPYVIEFGVVITGSTVSKSTASLYVFICSTLCINNLFSLNNTGPMCSRNNQLRTYCHKITFCKRNASPVMAWDKIVWKTESR